MTTFFSNKTIQVLIGLAFAFVFFLIPQKSFAACQLTHGQFRNVDYGIAFPLNWFSGSVSQNQAQPYAYLDLEFNPECVGHNDISVSIQEHDSLDSNDTVIPFFSLGTISATTRIQTLFFRTGDNWCDSGDPGDCDYFLLLKIGNQEYSYSPGSGGVGNQSDNRNIEYDCAGSCDDQKWIYINTAHQDNIPGYSYGAYVAENDPDNQQTVQTVSQGGDNVQPVSQGDNVQPVSQGDNVQSVSQGGEFAPATIECGDIACIENPLGDGSSLPAFVQSLLGIIIRAGIPIVVLALVYTGFRFVLARGNPEKISEAKHLLLYTVIGSAVVLGAWTIATILTNTINLIIS